MLSPAGTTHLVTRLERDGLVRRAVDPSDRRKWFTVLTGDGDTVLRAARRTHNEVLRRTFLAVTTAADRHMLERLWQRLSRAQPGAVQSPAGCGLALPEQWPVLLRADDSSGGNAQGGRCAGSGAKRGTPWPRSTSPMARWPWPGSCRRQAFSAVSGSHIPVRLCSTTARASGRHFSGPTTTL
jgi:hypothetical protein